MALPMLNAAKRPCNWPAKTISVASSIRGLLKKARRELGVVNFWQGLMFSGLGFRVFSGFMMFYVFVGVFLDICLAYVRPLKEDVLNCIF